MSKPCKVEGCERKREAKEWCLMHYKRWKRHGDPAVARKPQPPCSIPDCERPHLARGWCKQHYYRWYYTGDPLTPKRPTGRPATPCRVPGCEGARNGGGYCNKHGKRMKTWGDPSTLGYGTVTSQTPTYVYVIVNEQLGATKVGIGVESRLRKWNQRGWITCRIHLTDRDSAQRIERAVLDQWQAIRLPTPFTSAEVADGFTEVVASTVVAPAIASQTINRMTQQEGNPQ